LSIGVYRQVFSSTGVLLQDWEWMTDTMDLELLDDTVQDGLGYAYMAIPVMDLGGPTLAATQSTTATGRVLVSNIAQASTDPHAPSGSILINNGDLKTDVLTVTLSLAVDDGGGDHVGGPDDAEQGSPIEDIMMRVSNSPDFDGTAWAPFQAQVAGWQLGDVLPGQVATVYVEFKDAEGNVGDGGAAQMDSIFYPPIAVYLPLIVR